ncbi:MAG TPA: RodZ domain-containing protein [Actinomycetota bacterium]
MPGPTTGIGPALREARESLGKGLEEASRDTKIKVGHLQALERESFGAVGGDVYARGELRSYSAYLGLDPDKVVAAYSHAVDAAPETVDAAGDEPPAGEPRPIRTLHRRANWKLAFLVAVVVLAASGAAGWLSHRQSTPEATAATVTPSPSGQPLRSSDLTYVYLVASKPVDATVIADGTRMFSGTLRPGKPQQFTASTLARVWLSRGGVVAITVNGHELGSPGTRDKEYAASYTPLDYRVQSSSPAA